MNIMRTLKISSIFATATLLAPLLASAQQSAPPPPVMEKLEEGQAPEVTIRAPKSGDAATTTEKRAPDGTVTEVKVKTGKSTYVVKPVTRAGNSIPGDAQTPVTRPAQWEILEFNKDHKKKPNSTDDDLPAAPPPPLPAASAPAASAKK